MTITEGDVVNLGQKRHERNMDKLSNLTSVFQAYLDQLENYKSEFGVFQPLIDEYESDPGVKHAPSFYIELEFDKVITKTAKSKLSAAGFTVMNDDPDWGTEIHDDDRKYWSHGYYKSEREKNWYTQSSAWKEISKDNAIALFARRNDPSTMRAYGRYRSETPHYQKSDLRGDTKTGWDIRTHSRHDEWYHKSASFRIEMRAPDYSRDAAITDEAHMAEAVRVYDMIHHAEFLRINGGENVVSLKQ